MKHIVGPVDGADWCSCLAFVGFGYREIYQYRSQPCRTPVTVDMWSDSIDEETVC